jgi:hypothetical protein
VNPWFCLANELTGNHCLMRFVCMTEPGAAVLALLPDTGERYLSTWLFEGMNEGSDDEWLAAPEAEPEARAA